jgi:hypothetical protein
VSKIFQTTSKKIHNFLRSVSIFLDLFSLLSIWKLIWKDKRDFSFTGRFLPRLPKPVRAACQGGQPVRDHVSVWAHLPGASSPKFPLPAARVLAPAGNPPLPCSIPSPQRLPPLLQGRVTCVHATSNQLVISRVELLPHPVMRATTALAAAPPQCLEPGAW